MNNCGLSWFAFVQKETAKTRRRSRIVWKNDIWLAQEPTLPWSKIGGLNSLRVRLVLRDCQIFVQRGIVCVGVKELWRLFHLHHSMSALVWRDNSSGAGLRHLLLCWNPRAQAWCYLNKLNDNQGESQDNYWVRERQRYAWRFEAPEIELGRVHFYYQGTHHTPVPYYPTLPGYPL